MIEDHAKNLERRRNFRWLGWMLIWMGVFLLAQQKWHLAWGWGICFAGLLFYIAAVRPGGDIGWLFPGTILFCLGAAFVLLQEDWLKFEYWRLWSVLFGALGLGFVISFLSHYSGRWALVPGGVLLFAFGAGLADISWWRYQRVLRQVFDLWPLLVILAGSLLLIDYLKMRSKRQENQHL